MAKVRKDNDQRYVLRSSLVDTDGVVIVGDTITIVGTDDFSVTTNPVGTAALSYNDTDGVFTYTPPDLSSYLTASDLSGYLTAEADTLDSVTDRGATTTNAVTIGNLTSTGIDDNATSTAITISSSQIVTGLWNDNGTANTSSQIMKLTQVQYDAIGTPDSNTLYIIVG